MKYLQVLNERESRSASVDAVDVTWRALGWRHIKRIGRALLLVVSGAFLTGCVALAVSAVATSAAVVIASTAGEAAYSTTFRARIEDMDSLPEGERQQVRKVSLVTPVAGSTSPPIGKVKGLACQLSTASWSGRRWWPQPSEANGLTPEEVAMTQMKLHAHRAGGNAVVNWSCVHHADVDWLNNCFESWVCRGEAIRLHED